MKCKVCGCKTTLYKPGEEKEALGITDPDAIPGFILLKPGHFCPNHKLVLAIEDTELSMVDEGKAMKQPCKEKT